MLQVARERRLRKASEQAAQAAADSVDAERQRQAARAAQEATFLHLKVLHKLLLAMLLVQLQLCATIQSKLTDMLSNDASDDGVTMPMLPHVCYVLAEEPLHPLASPCLA